MQFSTRELVRAVVGLTTVFAVTLAYAQDRCDAILRNGIWEYSQSSNSQLVTESFLSWFCSQNFSSFGEAREKGLRIGIPIEDIPVEIDGHQRDSQWGKYYASSCSRQANRYQAVSRFSSLAVRASDSIATAWSACLASPGLYTQLKYGADPSVFTINIQNRGSTATDAAKLNSMAFEPEIACAPRVEMSFQQPHSLPSQGELTLLCKRPADKAVTIVLNADRNVKPSSTMIVAVVNAPDPAKYRELADEQITGSASIISDKIVIKAGATINLRANTADPALTVSAKHLVIEGPFTVNGAGTKGRAGQPGIGCHPEGGCRWVSGPAEDRRRCDAAWRASGSGHPHDVGVPGGKGEKGGRGAEVTFIYETLEGSTSLLRCNVPGGEGGAGGAGGRGRELVNCASGEVKYGPTGPQGQAGDYGESGRCLFTLRR